MKTSNLIKFVQIETHTSVMKCLSVLLVCKWGTWCISCLSRFQYIYYMVSRWCSRRPLPQKLQLIINGVKGETRWLSSPPPPPPPPIIKRRPWSITVGGKCEVFPKLTITYFSFGNHRQRKYETHRNWAFYMPLPTAVFNELASHYVAVE